MNILVLNSGSSSIKYRIYQLPAEQLMAFGSVERIGEGEGTVTHHYNDKEASNERSIKDHREGLHLVADHIKSNVLGNESIDAVGHRVVHGGEYFSEPVVITDDVLDKIEELSVLAPLHNPPNALGIKVARQIFAEAYQVAVFDTAYHQTLPAYAYRYPLPQKLYKEDRIRVYGMHGTSHQYVAEQTAHYLNQPLPSTSLITVHLGNGCSMTAIKNGKSIDTSMGLSPLAGLMMGTRSGDIDPSIPYYLGTQTGRSLKEIDNLLNHESGLKGIAGENDVRTILKKQEAGDEAATLALNMYCYRIKKFIGAYLAVLGRVDAIVFTAGVGENSSYIRQESLTDLSNLGIIVDQGKNQHTSKEIREIQSEESKIKVLVVPTNEELSIAQQSYALVGKK
uniref:Acetate kinase n=1 Tax=Roseihalotalea indica TaxID=2867963 RepID=A0AA49GM42_9BACT|nr:acetate kinase [Tunicatimonas sp. TK19036]